MRYLDLADHATSRPARPQVYHPVPTQALPTRVKAPATCGELIQGHLDGEDFLINCPIDLFAEAELQPVGMLGLHLPKNGTHDKVARALGMAAMEHDIRLAHALRMKSPIPRGKGMASSTADITAALGALLASQNIELDPAAFGELLSRIEPSDGVHFPGISHIDHLKGICHQSLPVPKGLRVLVLDCGGEVDTVHFDREQARAIYREHRDEVQQMLGMMTLGLQHGDLHLVGSAATISARLSQLILPKPVLEAVISLAPHAGALGVNCAHSGTVLGVLYRDDGSPTRAAQLHRLLGDELAGSVELLGDFAVIGGGVHEFA